MNISNETKGIIYIILSGFFYGFLGFFGTYALDSSPDIANMLFWRFFIASVFIALFVVPKIKTMKIDISIMATILTASAIFYGTSTFSFFLSAEHLGTGVAMVIFFTYPAIVVLCNSFIYKTGISRIYTAAVILILVGLLLLVEINSAFNYKGVLIGLLSAAGYAFYIMMSKKNNQLNPLLAALMVCIGCALFCFTYAAFNGSFFIPTTTSFWLHSFGLGILSTAVPILLLLEGLKHIDAEKASILGVLEPVFVAFIGVLLLGEELRFVQIIGVIVILGGALLSLRSQVPEEKIEVD